MSLMRLFIGGGVALLLTSAVARAECRATFEKWVAAHSAFSQTIGVPESEAFKRAGNVLSRAHRDHHVCVTRQTLETTSLPSLHRKDAVAEPRR